MQTLTRLMARLWQALFPPSGTTTQPHDAGAGGPESAENTVPTFLSDGEKVRHSLSERRVWPLLPTKHSKLTKDSNDIAFCTWMYYLN